VLKATNPSLWQDQNFNSAKILFCRTALSECIKEHVAISAFYLCCRKWFTLLPVGQQTEKEQQEERDLVAYKQASGITRP
jgi:hypothetical protein